MAENLELVQKGFRILHPFFAGYVCQEMSHQYQRAGGEEKTGRTAESAGAAGMRSNGLSAWQRFYVYRARRRPG